MDELMRERFTELADRLNELSARLGRLEQDDAEIRKALVVLWERLKKLEARHKPPLLRRRR